MKTFRYITHAVALAFLFAGNVMLSSCQDDIDVEPSATGLRLSPQLFGMFDKQTRAVDVDEITALITNLRENYMGKKLEVYVVGTGTNNASFFNRYIFEESEQITSKYYLMEQNWRQVNTTPNKQYVVGDHYRLYALVNRNSTDEINSFDDLKNATIGGVDGTHGIHRWYDASRTESPNDDSNSGVHYGWELDKTFAMDGYVDFEFSASDNDKQLDVNLKRAAAKIVLDLKIDPDFLKAIKDTIRDEVAGTETYEIHTGTPWVRPVNFNYHAYAADGIDNRDALAPQWYNANLYVIDERGSEVTPVTEINSPVRQYRLNTYCYPFSWEGDELEHTPKLVVSIGLHNSPKYYYYTIPITQRDVKELKRNHVYHIDATIKGYGALKVNDELEQVVDLHYDVMEWTVLDSEISLVDVEGDMDFLMVNPIEQSMYGENADPAVITFYAPDNNLVRYDDDEVDVYYYNAQNNKVTSGEYLPSGNYSIVKEGNTYKVSSSVLTNHAVKVIKFRVYFDANNNGSYDNGEKYEWVIVKHFPLDFFQNDQGLWSSRTTSGWWVYSNGTGTNPSGTLGDNNSLFFAKYYNNNDGYIYMAQYHEGWFGSGYWSFDRSSLTNRNKYIIQITETSSDYALGRVILDNNSQSQNHVVSPAFMIASQLGATINTTPSNNQIQTRAREAATHCQTYKEVDADGKEWTGWRLPTREEVGVILQYQHAGYDTMSPVMTGRYYWTLEGAAVATGINNENNQTWYTNWNERWKDTSYDYQSGSGNCYIRCIRDLSPDEVKTINAKIGHEND